MADTDFSKMKVVELRRELKARNLSAVGDKSELIERLQSAATKEDDNLSDDLGSDIVLDDEVEKEHILSEYQLESEGSEVHSAPKTKESVLNSPKRTLKRKPPSLASELDAIAEDKLLSPESPTPVDIPLNSGEDAEAPSAKKIILKRQSASSRQDSKEYDSDKAPESEVKPSKDDPSSQMEIRAKRFGLPATDDARKEARKQRFGNGHSVVKSATTSITVRQTDDTNNLEKLKKRAERFGGSVSTIMTKLEMQERLEKRKQKFGEESK